MGVVDLNLLAVNDSSIQFLDGGLRAGAVSHCHKGITLLGDVNISDFTTSGEFILQGIPWTPGIDSVDKKLGHRCYYASKKSRQ